MMTSRASWLSTAILLICFARTGGALVQPTGPTRPRVWVRCSSSQPNRRVRAAARQKELGNHHHASLSSAHTDARAAFP